jgi:hypothetical protein
VFVAKLASGLKFVPSNDGKRQRSNPLGMGDTQAPCSNKSMWGRLKIKIPPLYIAVRLRMTDVLNALALTLIT